MTVDGTTPLAFEVLGGWFHLDTLGADMEPALHQASALLSKWFGDRLRYTAASFDLDVRPFREADLEYIGCYAGNLSWVECAQASPGIPPLWAANLAKVGRDSYYVRAWSGQTDSQPGPHGVRFRAEIGPVVLADPVLPARAVLDFSVPIDTPLDEFLEYTMALARLLPIRWGAAGLTYSWESRLRAPSGSKAVYEHARRFLGFDVGYRVKSCVRLFDEIRSVNWLTFVGPALATRAGIKPGTSTTVDIAEVGGVGGALVIRATEAPARCDVNRLEVPPGYREADLMVRPVRSADGDSFNETFLGPWSASTINAWLRRFERRGL